MRYQVNILFESSYDSVLSPHISSKTKRTEWKNKREAPSMAVGWWRIIRERNASFSVCLSGTTLAEIECENRRLKRFLQTVIVENDKLNRLMLSMLNDYALVSDDAAK